MISSLPSTGVRGAQAHPSSGWEPLSPEPTNPHPVEFYPVVLFFSNPVNPRASWEYCESGGEKGKQKRKKQRVRSLWNDGRK